MWLEDVWVRYGARGPWILREVTAQLRSGEVAIVLGHNGAGKSTLLSAVAGVLPTARGTVKERPPMVGWVPERFPAEQPFTARGYLTHVARLRGLNSHAASDAIAAWAGRLHLTPFLDTSLANLSKGSAQKVGLTQALLVPPRLLVLDEPWEGLDAQTRELIPSIIAEVTEAGGAVLISDHRGEMVNLPHAARWHVADGRVEIARAAAAVPRQRCVIEIAVDATEVEATAARLRAEGHDVLAVRR
jgi:ABC-type multidrug transport system ATPase subunit